MSSPTPPSAARQFPDDLALLEGTVLGEGVVVDSRPVSFAVRMVSGAIDATVYGVVLWALILGATYLAETFGSVADGIAALGPAMTIVALVSIFVLLPVTIETLSRGRSVGKLAMGIRIVRDDGGPVRFRHAFVRGLVGIFELWLTSGGIAIIVAFFNDRGKRLGDLLAGTYAVRVRSGGIKPSALVMPPQLAAWAHFADIRPLPDGYALAARQFLSRAAGLSPQSRADLGVRVASLLEPYVAPGAPWGTHPEDFIAAVLAERRDRDLALAQHRLAVRQQDAVNLHRLPFGISANDR